LRTISVKDLTFAISMGAIGNALAAITIAPTIVRQVALDFSSLPVLIAGIFGGPVVGALAGFVAGILPSAFFGFIGGQLGILGFGTSAGKAISGLTIGILARAVKNLRTRTILLVPIVLLSFIPEAIWIYVLFTIFVPLFLPDQAILSAFVIPILAKGWFEMAVMSVFTTAIAGHNGFRVFLDHYLQTTGIQKLHSS
jgi:LytS/YehU family sensor histidine kinase